MTLPSQGAAHGAVFGTLGFFLIVTLIVGRKGLISKFDLDSYMSARNTQSALSLSLSFFASNAGAWVLFTVPEAAILGGPIAILGYALSCVFPLMIFRSVAPALRRNLPFGITFFEFVQKRYGTVVNVYVSLTAAFYMFLYLAAEFTSVGSCIALLSGSDGLAAIVGTSIVTLVYTSVGGLPVSLVTDRVQGVGVLIFTVLVVMAAIGYGMYPNYTDLATAQAASTMWATVTSWGAGGSCGDPPNAGSAFSMAIVLIIAVTSANLMHTGFQQRLWAAQSSEAVKQGLVGATILTIPFIFVFGFIGMIAFANFQYGLFAPDYVAFLAAFFVVGGAPTGWQVLAIMLAVMMVASSADTIQAGLSGLLTPMIDRGLAYAKGGGGGGEGEGEGAASKAAPMLALGINLAITVGINIAAIVLATQGISVLTLFVLADLLCATCAAPVIMGLSEKVHPIAALCGCVAGLVTTLIVYGVGSPGCGEGGNFEMLFAPGGLYKTTSLVAFLLTPTVSAITTALVALPFYLSGYKFEGFKAAEGEQPAVKMSTVEVATTSSA